MSNPALHNPMPPKGSKIAVAMSGGVDSSMAAYLLAQQGYELVGLTAWTLNGPGKCCNDALVNAGRVCEMLNIPYDTVDLRAEFAHFVMDYYNDSYQAGYTPNPCVECNRHVKWEHLVRYARETLNCDYLATGHYAILNTDNQGSVRVFRSVDEHKDQTYMMARVYPEDLRHTVFPLGAMTKPEVVDMARSIDIPTAYSKESQDICFVLEGQGNYMKKVFGIRKGPIIDIDTGKTLGEHDGYFRYTLGQRKGVKVAAGRAVYVVKIDPNSNTVYLGDAHHLQRSSFIVRDPSWISLPPGALQGNEYSSSLKKALPQDFAPFESMVKIRYNSPPARARIEPFEPSPESFSQIKVTLNEPFSAITPGQIAAFYDTDFQQLYGGGYIDRHLTHRTLNETEWADLRQNLPNLYCSV